MMTNERHESCEKCDKLSVSKAFCTHATSLYGKPIPIENLDKVPKWCPKRRLDEEI